jgi:hypothetical protein
MPRERDSTLSRLALLASRAFERRSLCDEFARLLEPLERGGLETVVGERSLLTELNVLLQNAVETIRQFQDTSPDLAALEAVQRLLADARWELAEDLLGELKEKSQRQSAVLRKSEIDVAEWENTLQTIERSLQDARNDGVPYPQLERDLLAVKSLVNSGRTALRDRVYAQLPQLMYRVPPHVQALSKKMEETRAKLGKAKNLVRQADLLVMQLPAGKGFDYRVLLRSARRLASRGINIIQDVSPLAGSDRAWMGEQLTKLTEGVNAGLSRQFQARMSAVESEAAPGVPRTLSPAEPEGGAPADIDLAIQMLGSFMFRLVIPEQMRTYLTDTSCSFTITTNDLELPWELMCFQDQSGSPRFFCLERPVARMPLGQVFPSTLGRARGPKEKRRMLLAHSDPTGNLPAARNEIEQIAQALKNDLDLETVTAEGATSANLNRILLSQNFDFLHYAGHAQFNAAQPELSGLLLRDDELLTAHKIRRLSEGGSLVFLNACESGVVARDDQSQRSSYLLRTAEPVVGLASSFVYSGAVGCIGSLWPIYDQPAAELAIQFYRHVLSGEMTGEALRLARLDTKARYPKQITWASFVLYGDPTFRLTEG